MASVSTDSPVARRIVQSFLHFLSAVETSPGVDKEGLEVAAQCLTEVFKLSPPRDGDDCLVPSLLKLFTEDATNIKSMSSDPQQVTGKDPQQDVSMDGEAALAGPSRSHVTELFEQFTDGLELSGYFNGFVEGSPEYINRIEQAKTIYEGSLKKFNYSAEQASVQDDAVLAEAFKVQGNTSMKEQRFMEAVQLYTLAISLCSNNAIFYANRAAAHSEIGKYGEAIADCEKAIQIDPSYSKAYSRLGWVYHAQGRYQEAIEKGFQKALNLDPNNVTAKENLLAAQQKVAEQHRERFNQQHQGYQQQEQQGQTSFGQAGMNFGGQLPGNIQLPPEMANLIPGIMNLAAQFGQQQQDNMHGGPAEATNQGDGHHSEQDDEDVHVDANINFTVNGQELPPQFANLMGSVLQMFGNGSGAGGNSQFPQSPHPQGPPGGSG